MFSITYFSILLYQLLTKQAQCEFLRRGALYAIILLHTGAGNCSPQCLIQTFMMSHPCKTHFIQEGTISLKVYVAVIFKWYFSTPIEFSNLYLDYV